MSFWDYIPLIRLVIEILKVIMDQAPEDQEKMAQVARRTFNEESQA